MDALWKPLRLPREKDFEFQMVRDPGVLIFDFQIALAL